MSNLETVSSVPSTQSIQSVPSLKVPGQKVLLQNEVPFGKKEVTIREWKGKDRKAFKALIKESENLSEEDIAQVLVYNCIEEDVVLNPYELKYILGLLRSKSISDDIKFKWTCECSHLNTLDLKISEIQRGVVYDGEAPEFKLNGKTVIFKNVKNSKKYKELMTSANEERFLVDMALHIHSIDGDESRTLQEILDYFDEECTTKELDQLWNQYRECMFKLDDINELTCERCNTKQKYRFDEIPGFFPETWFL